MLSAIRLHIAGEAKKVETKDLERFVTAHRQNINIALGSDTADRFRSEHNVVSGIKQTPAAQQNIVTFEAPKTDLKKLGIKIVDLGETTTGKAGQVAVQPEAKPVSITTDNAKLARAAAVEPAEIKTAAISGLGQIEMPVMSAILKKQNAGLRNDPVVQAAALEEAQTIEAELRTVKTVAAQSNNNITRERMAAIAPTLVKKIEAEPKFAQEVASAAGVVTTTTSNVTPMVRPNIVMKYENRDVEIQTNELSPLQARTVMSQLAGAKVTKRWKGRHTQRWMAERRWC